MRLLYVLFFLTYINCIQAQWYSLEKVNKKVLQWYEKSYSNYRYGNYKQALVEINEAIKLDNRFVDGYLTRAGIYNEQKLYDKANQDYKIAIQLDSIFTIDFITSYAQTFAGLGKFKEAENTLDLLPEKYRATYKYADKKKYYQNCLMFAQQWQSQQVVNLGKDVNSPGMDYFPSLSIDENELFFNRRIDNRNEDFFVAQKQNDEFTNTTPLPNTVNTPYNEAAQQISLDGNWLVFAGCDYPEGFGSCDIYISQKIDGKWQKAKNLGNNVNSNFWETTPCFSPDAKTIYFSSNRPGGYGESDIWYTKLVNGIWQKPINMGAGINTPQRETCPFLHPDNKHFYFNSTGWPGYGKADLFLSIKNNKNEWEKPINLGYPINTIDEELSLVINAKGNTAYYASDKFGGFGSIDLYKIELPKLLQANNTKWVTGKISDAKTKQPLKSKLEVVHIGTNQIYEVESNNNGQYFLTLPDTGTYIFNVTAPNFLLYSNQIKLNKNDNTSLNIVKDSAVFDIALQPIEKGKSIILKNIFFDVNEFTIKNESEVELKNLVKILNENPKIKIEIGGHTDNTGIAKKNIELSQKRAQAVVKYLVDQKISATRLVAKGYGQLKPIADNKTEQGRSLNRRTEFTILAN